MKTTGLIRDRLAGARQLDLIIDAGILSALVITVLLTSLLLSTMQLSGPQLPTGFAQAMAESQTTTAHTAPGHLTPVLLLVGVMAFGVIGAYYFMVRKPQG